MPEAAGLEEDEEELLEIFSTAARGAHAVIEATVASLFPRGIDSVSASSRGSKRREAKRAPDRDAARAAAEGRTRSHDTEGEEDELSFLLLLFPSSPSPSPSSFLRATGATTNSHPGPKKATGNPRGSMAVATSDTGAPPPPARGMKTGKG